MGWWGRLLPWRRQQALTAAAYVPAVGGSVLAPGHFAGLDTGWQAEAVQYFDLVPELRYGIVWQAAAASRGTLYTARIPERPSQPPQAVEENDPAAGPLRELASTAADQAALIYRTVVNLRLTGQLYLVGMDRDGRNEWIIASVNEIEKRPDGWYLRTPGTDQPIKLGSDSSKVIPIWWPHPTAAMVPDAPTRALLATFQELLDLSAHVQSSARSRLAGAGILLMPTGLSVSSPGTTTGTNPLHDDPIMNDLITAMSAALKNRRDASAIVPIFLKGHPEALDKIRHLTLSTPFDERLNELRNAAIRRIATGLDIPPEILTGMADVNHWTAWSIEESAIKVTIEPLLAFICDMLTERFLRPALVALEVPNPDAYQVWFDTTAIKLRPNKSAEALEAFRLNAITAEALVRELGLDPLDVRRDNVVTPGARTPSSDADRGIDGTDVPDNNRGPASGEETQVLAAAAGREPDAVWLARCADLGARRALQRAGRWVLASGSRAQRGELRDTPPDQIHTRLPIGQHQLDAALDGAYSEISEVAPELVPTVDVYVRRLLVSGTRHEKRHLAAHLGR